MAATCSSPAVPPTLFRHNLSSQGSRHGSRCDLLSSPIQSLVVCHAHVLILSVAVRLRPYSTRSPAGPGTIASSPSPQAELAPTHPVSCPQPAMHPARRCRLPIRGPARHKNALSGRMDPPESQSVSGSCADRCSIHDNCSSVLPGPRSDLPGGRPFDVMPACLVGASLAVIQPCPCSGKSGLQAREPVQAACRQTARHERGLDADGRPGVLFAAARMRGWMSDLQNCLASCVSRIRGSVTVNRSLNRPSAAA